MSSPDRECYVQFSDFKPILELLEQIRFPKGVPMTSTKKMKKILVRKSHQHSIGSLIYHFPTETIVKVNGIQFIKCKQNPGLHKILNTKGNLISCQSMEGL